ncbi:MAG: hypothetical protein LBQ24_06080 [Candidatus Peribacteria bacterium]|nr:hypothetical protein [Candidatus Peribacteria bacterium]
MSWFHICHTYCSINHNQYSSSISSTLNVTSKSLLIHLEYSIFQFILISSFHLIINNFIISLTHHFIFITNIVSSTKDSVINVLLL